MSRDQFNDTLREISLKVPAGIKVRVSLVITLDAPTNSAVIVPAPALPGGNRNNNGGFNNLGNNANFWSSSENGSSNAWNRNLNYNNDGANRNNNNRRNGFSVRCLRN